eukprot:60664_1
MPRAHGTKTVSILSWQILGWVAFFFNMVVTFMVAAIWQCGDDKHVTIESTKRFKALLSESLKNQPELTIEYNGMEYVLDTENIKHVSIMDGKCFNAAVHHMPASADFCEPFATKLIPFDSAVYLHNPKTLAEKQLYGKAVYKGYTMESMTYSDTAVIGNMIRIHRWELDDTLDSIVSASNADPYYIKPEIFVFPVKTMIDAKVNIIDHWITINHSNCVQTKVIHALRMKYAKVLKIGYLRQPDEDLLRTPIIPGCHMIMRVIWDKYLFKLTCQRRLDNIKPDREIKILGDLDSRLKGDAEKLRELNNRLTNTKYLKVNQTATKTKMYSHLAGHVALVTDSQDPSPLQTIRNVAYLYTMESACHIISELINDDKTVRYNDAKMDQFVSQSIKRYETILDLSPKSYSPALLKTFVIGPMSVVNWKHEINEGSPVQYCYPGDLDQGTELLGKVCKDYNVATGHGKIGFMQRLMEHMNFAHIAAIEDMVGKWHISKSDQKALHQPLHDGLYPIEAFTPFFQSLMSAARQNSVKDILRNLYNRGYSLESLSDISAGFEQEPLWNLEALNEAPPSTIVQSIQKKASQPLLKESKEKYPYPCRYCDKKI